jgi:L-ribulose-5-phosphate 4-epimerase
VLLGRHGVFAWGADPESAVKAAAMVEDVAKTVWLALQIGSPISLTESEIAGWWDRYHSRYGQ